MVQIHKRATLHHPTPLGPSPRVPVLSHHDFLSQTTLGESRSSPSDHMEHFSPFQPKVRCPNPSPCSAGQKELQRTSLIFLQRQLGSIIYIYIFFCITKCRHFIICLFYLVLPTLSRIRDRQSHFTDERPEKWREAVAQRCRLPCPRAWRCSRALTALPLAVLTGSSEH